MSRDCARNGPLWKCANKSFPGCADDARGRGGLLLIRELGPDAYAEARLMQRKATSADERRRWRDVALLIARNTGKRIGLDTATRIPLDANERAEPQASGLEPRKVDPIDELKRLIRK